MAAICKIHDSVSAFEIKPQNKNPMKSGIPYASLLAAFFFS